MSAFCQELLLTISKHTTAKGSAKILPLIYFCVSLGVNNVYAQQLETVNAQDLCNSIMEEGLGAIMLNCKAVNRPPYGHEFHVALNTQVIGANIESTSLLIPAIPAAIFELTTPGGFAGADKLVDFSAIKPTRVIIGY